MCGQCVLTPVSSNSARRKRPQPTLHGSQAQRTFLLGGGILGEGLSEDCAGRGDGAVVEVRFVVGIWEQGCFLLLGGGLR